MVSVSVAACIRTFMVDPDAKYLDALNAFADQQYGQCLVSIEAIGPLKHSVFIQLYIICMQRLGFMDVIRAFTERILPQVAEDQELDALVRLALGLTEPEAAAPFLDPPDLQFCLGSRLLTLGDVTAAREHLSRCAQHRPAQLEQVLARMQLEWPSQEPPREDYRDAVLRAYTRAFGLFQTKNPNALDAATEAYRLARRALPFGEVRIRATQLLAHVLFDAHQLDAAEQHCREVLFLHRFCSLDVESEVIETLVLLGRIFLAQRRYNDADEVLNDALDHQRMTSAPDGAEVAIILKHLVTVAEEGGDQERIVTARLQHFEVAIDVDGAAAVHSDGKALFEVLRSAGHDDEAERICRTWLDRSAAADPPWLPGVIAALSRLADVLDDQRRYEESRACHDRIIAVLASVSSSDEIAARKSYMFSRLRAGDPAGADAVSEPLPDLARQYGIEDDSLAEALVCRALCLQELGQHADSIGLLEEALLRASDDGAAVVRGLLSEAYAALEDPAAALANERALVDLLRNDEPLNQDTAVRFVKALNRLAVTLLHLRKLHEANDLLAEAAQIVEGHPEMPPSVKAALLNSRGAAAMQADFYSYAHQLFVAADQVVRNGDTDIDPLPILANLLRCSHNMRADPADDELIERIAIYGETADGLARADALQLLGEDAMRRSEPLEAIKLLHASLVANDGSSRSHLEARASCQVSLATALGATGDFAAAFEAAAMAQHLHEIALLEAGITASEQERLRILAKHRRDLGQLFTLLTRCAADPAAVRAAWQILMRSRGLAYEAMAVQRPAGNRDTGRLAGARSELAAFDLRGFPVVGESEDAFAIFHAFKTERDALRRRVARLEESLGATPDCRVRLESVLGTIADEVIAAIPPGTALLEFVRYDVTVFSVETLRTLAEPVQAYGAFLVAAGGQPAYFALGTAVDVEDALLKPSRTAELLAEILAAISPDIKRLVVVPDGLFARVSLAGLPAPGCGQLIDHFVISYVDAARDITATNERSVSTAPAVVVSNPDFDLTEGAQLDAETATTRTIFAPLPGTSLEANAVTKMLAAVHWFGADATKPKLLQMRAPAVLHLATHGFFLEGDVGTEWEVDHGLAFGVAPEHLKEGRLTGGRLGNPFLRSGLALAGANDWVRTGQVRPWGDGLFTANDLAGLDLRGTQLVVFSACDAGLGAIRSGEGIIGLRRAAHLAGARAQIMALGRVPDFASAFLMISLYEILGDPNIPGDLALRQAQLQVRDATIQTLRETFLNVPFTDILSSPLRAWLTASDPAVRPFHEERNWASFVYVGPQTRLDIRAAKAFGETTSGHSLAQTGGSGIGMG
jgi:CHAT domain-containing protein/tetratricopeptide (TPR) repeat protein